VALASVDVKIMDRDVYRLRRPSGKFGSGRVGSSENFVVNLGGSGQLL